MWKSLLLAVLLSTALAHPFGEMKLQRVSSLDLNAVLWSNCRFVVVNQSRFRISATFKVCDWPPTSLPPPSRTLY